MAIPLCSFEQAGEGLISWVKLFYHLPKAVIREARKISSAFELGKGTRQGCPLSPFLFACAIEPLMAVIRSNTNVVGTGFRYEELHEKNSLYSDDNLLMFGIHPLHYRKLC